MNPNLFLADFGHIANAPGGISRLREMIYNLAVTGALSEQRRSDGDGHALLEEITVKKQALSDAGKYKRSPKLENFRDAYNENLPKVPATWAWSRLVEVGEISPRNEAEDDSMASFASMSAISEMHSSAVASEDRPWGNIKKGYTHFANGDVVLAKITPCFENGKAAVMANLTNGIGAGTTELHVVRPIAGVIEPGYIYIFLRSPYFKIVGEGHMTGTAGQKRLPTEYFATRPFPLPPLAEQKRIVAKVDELMALCDQLEAQQLERERRFPVLSRTCHARFAEAPTSDNLNHIFDEIGAVSPDDLRKTILTLAVQAKLVPQEASDESAVSGLLACGVDLNRWAVAKDEERQDIPSSWTWIRFAGVGEQRLGKMLDAGKNIGKSKPYLRNTNVQWMRFELDDVKKMRIEEREEEELRLKDGDLLICEGGEPGRCAIWRNDVSEMYFQKALHRVRPCDAVLAEFLALNLQIDCRNGVLAGYFTGATIKHLTGRSLSSYPIPIPPLAEQRRIVVKVDELMALVDQLEAQQQERDKLAEAFAKACVASFTGTTQLERPGKMKAPKTELVSLVTLGKKSNPDVDAPLARLLIQNKGTLPAKTLWQQSGLMIDAFYQQLKTEIAQGWIAPPAEAEMKVVEQD
jgi:type I restriction enzyme S subunit